MQAHLLLSHKQHLRIVILKASSPDHQFDTTCTLVRNANSVPPQPYHIRNSQAGVGKEFQQALQVILKLTEARCLSANYLWLRPARVPYPPEETPLHGLSRQGMTQC